MTLPHFFIYLQEFISYFAILKIDMAVFHKRLRYS